jgi:hypothetical protein
LLCGGIEDACGAGISRFSVSLTGVFFMFYE